MAASAKVKKVHLLSALTFGHFAWAKLDDPQYVQERDQVLLAIACPVNPGAAYKNIGLQKRAAKRPDGPAVLRQPSG